MSAAFWLRTAACITALLAVGHLLGSPWTPVHSADGQHVIDAMRSYHFQVMKLDRSYGDFYQGFGWMIGAYLLAHAILFRQLAGLASEDVSRLRPVVAILSIEYVLVAVLASRFLFWIPLFMSAAIAAALLLGWLALWAGRRADRAPAMGLLSRLPSSE